MKIAFYKGKGRVLDFLIKLKTNSKYSHTEIVFSDNLSFSSSHWDKCSRFKKIEYNKNDWDFLELEISKEKEQRIRSFCEKEKGKECKCFKVVIMHVLGLYKKSKNEWFCSQICSAALQNAHIVEGITPYLVNPIDLYELLLEEDTLKGRRRLNQKYQTEYSEKNRFYIQILSVTFGVLLLVFIISAFIDRTLVEAFLLQNFNIAKN